MYVTSQQGEVMRKALEQVCRDKVASVVWEVVSAHMMSPVCNMLAEAGRFGPYSTWLQVKYGHRKLHRGAQALECR